MVCKSNNCLYQERLCHIPKPGKARLKLALWYWHNCSHHGESLPYYTDTKSKTVHVPRLHMSAKEINSGMFKKKKKKWSLTYSHSVGRMLRIHTALWGKQHCCLHCLLALILQHDWMASSGNGTIYLFSNILSMELDICISHSINTIDRKICLAVGNQPASPVNCCSGTHFLYICTYIERCIATHV